jgi:two-component system chemotaxis response regulator CheY
MSAMATILAVDDSVSMRKLVAATLAEAGHRVVEAADGVEALAAAKANSLNLIISDVNMPNMDGLSFVKQVRGLPQYKFVPILMLTTEIDPTKKQEARAAGATGWMVKPFSPEKLLDTIRKVLG